MSMTEPTSAAPMASKPPTEPVPSEQDVRRMLAGVIDPELHVSIVELGMVDDIQVEPDGQVTVKVALTTAGCPLRHQIKTEVQSKVLGLPGVADVRVDYGEMTAEQKAAA